MGKFRRMNRLVSILKLWSFRNEVPRSVALNKEAITAVDLHIFGDASVVESSVCSSSSTINSKPKVSC